MSFLRSWHSRSAKLKLLFRSRYYTRLFNRCGKGLAVYGRITVYYPDRISVGHHCTMNEWCVINAAAPVTIGDKTRISAGVIITTAGLEKQSDPHEGARRHLSKEIRIGKNVWIGARAVILPGVTIGDNSIIGAGAVVSKDIPADVVAMGVPARVHSSL